MAHALVLLVVLAVGWAIALGLAALGRLVDAASSDTTDLRVVASAALLEAQARGHATVTQGHIALALTFDPEVAERLARVVDLDALRARLEAHVAAQPERDDDGSETRDELGVDRLFAKLLGGAARKTPPSYLTALLETLAVRPDAAPGVHAAFQGSGLDGDAWARSSIAAPTGPSSTSGKPYRARPATRSDHLVRFWNDDATPMNLVVDLMSTTFGRPLPEARYLMLRTHIAGSAAFGRFEPEEARALADAATARAREAGAPLRITVEGPDAKPPRSLWGRIFGG